MADDLTPARIVCELDKHIVGQAPAKRAVAVAIRNRWRRQQLTAELRKDVMPRNILMIGPTGVGKTEIARRLADLVGAPFLKVEATKYTEVGYHGRDVESMIRDLTDVAVGLVRAELRGQVQQKATERVTDRLLDLLLPNPGTPWMPDDHDEAQKRQRTREKLRTKLLAGELEERNVEVTTETKPAGGMMLGGMNMGQLDPDMEKLLENVMPKNRQTRSMPIREARRHLLEQESDALIEKASLGEKAVERVEQHGIVFLDEIDKVCSTSASAHGPDISRQGVQRDLLPIVEGTTVTTRHGPVRTDHILFIAAGAFHVSKPSDLMPELQGRFPIRVELTELVRDDFLRILTEPKHSLTRQYVELLATEKVRVRFTDDGLAAMADIAYSVNRTTQNIGARRLQTVLERVLEEISFTAPDLAGQELTIDGTYVRERLESILQREDLSRFIL